MRLGEAEVCREKRDMLGRHGVAAVGVDGELVTLDALPLGCLSDEALRQARRW